MSEFSLAASIQSLERLFLAPWKKAPAEPAAAYDFFTPLDEAVVEIQRRRQNPVLMAQIAEYLHNDIPKHFTGPDPIFYLSRYAATPNYETLRFIELTKDLPYRSVIGQDRDGKFVSNNELKRALGKLPVTKGVSHTNDEIIEYFTIIDFNTANGKPMSLVDTKFKLNLVEFHNKLFREIYDDSVISIADETEWVTRNHRDNLLEQYKHMLALMCAHGIMFESYPPSELLLVETILRPALAEIEQQFGCKPLIVEHIPGELELLRDWNAYPSVLYPFIKRSL